MPLRRARWMFKVFNLSINARRSFHCYYQTGALWDPVFVIVELLYLVWGVPGLGSRYGRSLSLGLAGHFISKGLLVLYGHMGLEPR